jgi:hypothetical protein
MSDTIEEVIDRQYQELSKKFRPIFGNDYHIQLVKDIAAIDAMTKDIKKKEEASRDVKRMIMELSRLKRNALYLLKR